MKLECQTGKHQITRWIIEWITGQITGQIIGPITRCKRNKTEVKKNCVFSLKKDMNEKRCKEKRT